MDFYRTPGAEELAVDDLKEDLESCFTSFNVAGGTFAHSARVVQYPNPGLHVEGVGLISLPLTDASGLKGCGGASATVRKTWEVDGGEVTFQNPAWEEWVGAVVLPDVLEGLGVGEGVEVDARLYKLLLYDEGGLFRAHEDTEKEEGMFGTLVICLPGVHTNGDVRLTHNETEIVWSSSKDSAFGVSYGAWYADVIHEIERVTSGHRLVLTYNLINMSGDEELSAETVEESNSQLTEPLEQWLEANLVGYKNDIIQYLCWGLGHTYSEASLRLSNLKGEDLPLVKHVAAIAKRSGFTVLLATMEKDVSGPCEDEYEDDDYDPYDENNDLDDHRGGSGVNHTITDIVEQHLKLTKVVDLNGKLLAKGIVADEQNIIQEDLFDGVDPSRENYTPWQGNYGCESTQWYRQSIRDIISIFHSLHQDMLSATPGDTRPADLLGSALSTVENFVRNGLPDTRSSRRYHWPSEPTTATLSDKALLAVAEYAMYLHEPWQMANIAGLMKTAPDPEYYQNFMEKWGTYSLPRTGAANRHLGKRLGRRDLVESEPADERRWYGHGCLRCLSRHTGAQRSVRRIVPKVVEHADRTAFFLAFLAEYYVNGGDLSESGMRGLR
ncbi:hypothetical protein KVT40_004933 [Elsinoe batatas]|uniref:Prolyl 4-hydroxylase alpha subunit Fe(2+) 2OG dioxygenase domain-containing protein n=1 Tax=Elsinoe batatas TaxID=2601811 RepID=A0A8K0PCY4_9PEZI|nr:hypothetical protein KVT40_004933 [Elsinoe batatas]